MYVGTFCQSRAEAPNRHLNDPPNTVAGCVPDEDAGRVSTLVNPYGPPRAVLHRPSVPTLVGLFALCSLAGVAGLVALVGLMSIGVFLSLIHI